jgi:hypothetical protein
MNPTGPFRVLTVLPLCLAAAVVLVGGGGCAKGSASMAGGGPAPRHVQSVSPALVMQDPALRSLAWDMGVDPDRSGWEYRRNDGPRLAAGTPEYRDGLLVDVRQYDRLSTVNGQTLDTSSTRTYVRERRFVGSRYPAWIPLAPRIP